MLTLRKAADRGHAVHGWLDSWHSFSFADYYDPRHMGVSALRVLNEDRIAPGAGFPTHPHQDMEILTYVLEGAVEHRDSTGTHGVIRPGEVQRMSAGTGIRHSEMNHSSTELLHLLQIWIQPAERGIAPGYEQRAFPVDERRGRLRLLASPDAAQESVRLHQDVRVYGALLTGDEAVTYSLHDSRIAYVHVARGELTLDGTPLKAGDAASVSGQPLLHLRDGFDAEVLLFDLPKV
ncbi:pirin family protein [Acidihalobacter ferrooxydans]|uniref:Quercetin 2,3-dioxygenase n=1 Tax=Acidihalobacter ferrooxydans TaxID=1765967 RepID=A0A1P8UKM9_9GAMM|nr:pirin family protein [Acidihalobacter ferrooxydans]APZ44407.1 quercetin 2,3-dioxygenase [Acidihalobacter ferrooxydans]